MTSRENIALVASRLGNLRERVVFVGGATTELLLSDPNAGPVRPTDDVDLIIPAKTRFEFLQEITEQLRTLGFKPDMREDAPAGDALPDVIPEGQEIGQSVRPNHR